ncbi:cysteine proteinase [Xylariaceae sp. FL0255]|nr:cysteine proteinase [Xylariaceae sp. FL0255]
MKSVFTREQIDQFLHYIGLPEEHHHAPPTLDLLTQLHVYVLAAIPYENLAIHYNPSHQVIIDPQYCFKKVVVENRGRGGYCMENAIVYNEILVGLGFDSYTAGVRTRMRVGGVPGGDYPGWVHIVSIVLIDGQKYHVDTAFGGDCATMPMPLVDGLVHANIGTQQIRLRHDWIPAQQKRTEEHKLWIYEYRNSADSEFLPFYAFVELEFMPNDWEVCNYWTSTNVEKSWQTRTVIIIKFLRRKVEGDEKGREEIFGKRMLVDGVVKENLGRKTHVVCECKTEEERVAAIEKYFGIRLTEDEKGSIKGWRTELV